MTLGAQAARVRARIDAPVIAARSIIRTLGVHDTLGPALRRLATVAGQTRACRLLVVLATLRVGTARRRLTGETMLDGILDAWRLAALEERIADHAVGTGAGGHVGDHVADGVRAADADARIDALVLHAGEVLVAVVVRFALTATAALHVERIAFVAGQAEAGAGVVGLATLGVRAARRRAARLVPGNGGWREIGGEIFGLWRVNASVDHRKL